MADPVARPELAPLSATVMRPGVIWSCGAGPEGAIELRDGDLPPGEASFRWLHLNLADQRSLRWIERTAALPPGVLALMLSHDTHPHLLVEDGAMGLVLHDFERDFDTVDAGRAGALFVAVTDRLMLTGRRHPVLSADLARRRIVAGAYPVDAPAALDLILSAVIDTVAERVLDITAELLAAEDGFLNEDRAPDTRALVSVRRRSSRLHRIIGGMRATLHRMEAVAGVPPALLPVAARAVQRLAALDGDIAAAQTQLRLLRDEFDLQATQRTNRNLYLLSVMTALMMPATLVTGFFGMNTGGLPFGHDGDGTALALVLAVTSSAATYLALRMMGLVRS